ncbi:hypothetical protein ACEPAF_4198 [Sanghuangporus sanghuang]
MASAKTVTEVGFQPPPPTTSKQLIVSFPAEHTVQLTLNRPEAMNAMSPTLQDDLERTLAWFDAEPSLWVGILTGSGRIFCAGADLKAWDKEASSVHVSSGRHNPEGIVGTIHGFGSISRRTVSCKPLIAAVIGGAYGGGVEILLNCDLVIAADDATFGLPEVKVGATAALGGIPRLVATAGLQRASEMLLLGRTISAHEACSRFGFVNKTVPKTQVLIEALSWAKTMVNDCSPDAVQSTKRGMILAWQHGDVDSAMVKHAYSAESVRHYAGENIKEGLRAFGEKRKPKWTNPAKL